MIWRLVTQQRRFVANVEPVLPLELIEGFPRDVLFWGSRVFIDKGEGIWQETFPMVVRTCER